MISRTIMFRGQIRKKGEKVTYGGIPLPGIWVTGGIFPQNGTGDKAIIYSQKPAVEKYVVYADTVGQYTGVSDSFGHPIYEDDIILFYIKGESSVYYSKGTVKYYDALASFAVSVCEQEQRSEPVMLKDCICASVIGNTHDGILDDDDEKMRQFYIECLLLASDISNLISRYAPNNDAFKAETLSHMAIRLVDASSRYEVINGLKEFCDEWKDSSCQEPYQRAHAILEQMQIVYNNFSEKE